MLSNSPPSFPPELWSELFKILVWDDFHFPAQAVDPPAIVPLSQVCRSWRDLIYSTPLLWNALRLHDPHPDSRRLQPVTSADFCASRLRRQDKIWQDLMESFNRQLSKWLNKSNPLSFYFKVTVDGPYATDLHILHSPSAHRFRSIDVAITHESKHFVSLRHEPLMAADLQHRLPQLQHFSVQMIKRTTHWDFNRDGHVPISLNDGGPVWDQHCPRGWTGMATPRLKSFHANVPLRPIDVAKVLYYAPATLVECTIEAFEVATIHSKRLPPGFLKPFHNLKTFTVVLHIPSSLEFLGSWNMPVLEELTIRGCEAVGRPVRNNDGGDDEEAHNFKALRQTAFEKRADASSALRSVTFDTVPWIEKDEIFTLLRSSHSLSHLRLINMPQVHEPFFADFGRTLDITLDFLSLDVVIDTKEDNKVFPSKEFVQFIVENGHRIRIELRLLARADGMDNVAGHLKKQVEAELFRCNIHKDVWPRIETGPYISSGVLIPM